MGGSQIDTFYAVEYLHHTYDVHVVMGNDGPLGDACRAAGIPVTVIPMKNRLLDPAGDLRAFVGLLMHFRGRRPDIVHTHTSKAGILGRLAARLAGVTVVVHTIHIPPYHDCQSSPVRWLLIRLERWCSRYTDRYVTVAQSLGDVFVRDGVCRRQQLTTIRSAIDFSRFNLRNLAARQAVRREFDISDSARVVISVANLEARKLHEVLIDAAAVIIARHDDVVFLIAGTGEMRPQLEKHIEGLDLGSRVQLLGERNDVPMLLAASDIFVQTSRLEGLSRSLIEAMYVGLPVVASDVNATRELVIEGQTGYLVAPGDTQALTDRLSFLLTHEDVRVRIGGAAHCLVESGWSIRAMGEAHDALYGTLLRQRTVSGAS